MWSAAISSGFEAAGAAADARRREGDVCCHSPCGANISCKTLFSSPFVRKVRGVCTSRGHAGANPRLQHCAPAECAATRGAAPTEEKQTNACGPARQDIAEGAGCNERQSPWVSAIAAPHPLRNQSGRAESRRSPKIAACPLSWWARPHQRLLLTSLVSSFEE